MKIDIFLSSVRPSGDLAGVLECDEETSYFYLYKPLEPKEARVVSSCHICSGIPAFSEDDLRLKWTANWESVGLFIRDTLWAAFDSKGHPIGGDFELGKLSSLSEKGSRYVNDPVREG